MERPRNCLVYHKSLKMLAVFPVITNFGSISCPCPGEQQWVVSGSIALLRSVCRPHLPCAPVSHNYFFLSFWVTRTVGQLLESSWPSKWSLSREVRFFSVAWLGCLSLITAPSAAKRMLSVTWRSQRLAAWAGKAAPGWMDTSSVPLWWCVQYIHLHDLWWQWVQPWLLSSSVVSLHAFPQPLS